jgi:hypothetical protein
MKNILSTSFRFLIFVLFASCQQEKNDYLNIACNKSNDFKYEVPSYPLSYNNTQEQNKYLSIPLINKPSDTLCLRIDAGTKKDTVKIFEFKQYKAFVSFIIYKYPIGDDGRIAFNNREDNIEKFQLVFEPNKKRVNLFLNKLSENKILELPNGENIYGYDSDSFHGWVSIEYANKCKYSLKDYKDPYQFSKKSNDAKNLVNFLNYLNLEFGF